MTFDFPNALSTYVRHLYWTEHRSVNEVISILQETFPETYGNVNLDKYKLIFAIQYATEYPLQPGPKVDTTLLVDKAREELKNPGVDSTLLHDKAREALMKHASPTDNLCPVDRLETRKLSPPTDWKSSPPADQSFSDKVARKPELRPPSDWKPRRPTDQSFSDKLKHKPSDKFQYPPAVRRYAHHFLWKGIRSLEEVVSLLQETFPEAYGNVNRVTMKYKIDECREQPLFREEESEDVSLLLDNARKALKNLGYNNKPASKEVGGYKTPESKVSRPVINSRLEKLMTASYEANLPVDNSCSEEFQTPEAKVAHAKVFDHIRSEELKTSFHEAESPENESEGTLPVDNDKLMSLMEEGLLKPHKTLTKKDVGVAKNVAAVFLAMASPTVKLPASIRLRPDHKTPGSLTTLKVKTSRNNIFRWLVYLTQNNPLYKHIKIDLQALKQYFQQSSATEQDTPASGPAL